MPIKTGEELLFQQQELQAAGKQLLDTSRIKEILSTYGAITEGGSYVYGLMTYPDIDLGVITDEPTKELFDSMVAELTAHAGVCTVKTSDRVNEEHEIKKAIKGYWVGFDIDFADTLWHLDIWYQKPEWRNDKTAEWVERFSMLSPEKRIAILRMKEQLRAEGRYGIGKEFVGVDVYKAVLDMV